LRGACWLCCWYATCWALQRACLGTGREGRFAPTERL
jgi:hypothetical protein